MKSGQKVVRETGCELCKAVRRRWSNQEKINGLGDENMIEGAFEVGAGVRALEEVHVDFVTRERPESQWCDELRCPFGHQDRDFEAAVL